MASEHKVIAVVGATGHQGLSVVRAILTEGDRSEFRVRAIAKNIAPETVEWMKKEGVDVRDMDINDVAEVTAALEGCYGLFAVTLYWQHMSPEEELRQAKTMAAAAKRAGVEHIVWSTLEDTRKALEKSNVPTLHEKYKVPPFDAKAEADRYFAECGVPTTYVITPFFWDNFIDFGMGPKKTPDGKLEIALPMADKKLAGIASEDIGMCILTIFKHPKAYHNKRIGFASEDLTLSQIAEKMSNVLGKEVRYRDISVEDYRRQNIPGVNELANMFKYFQDNEEEVTKIRCTQEAHKLNPNVMPFDRWVLNNKHLISVGA